MGLKQPKKEDDHDAVPVGAVMWEGSLATWETRLTQWSTSCCISDFSWVGAAIVDSESVWEGGRLE